MAGKMRKSDSEQNEKPVKLSVEVDVLTHSKLAALAALRRCSQSSIAAEAIRAAVSSVVVFDKIGRAHV